MNKKHLILACALALGLSGCLKKAAEPPREPDHVSPSQPGEQPAWVHIDPVQCMGNPWQGDWMQEHGNDYPGRVDENGMNEEESGIIRAYYEKQGVTVLDSRIEWTHKATCEACSCPQGYTLYLSVPSTDVPKMTELHFTVAKTDIPE